VWLYKGENVSKLPDTIRYFVYHIKYKDGAEYIGSKVVRSEVRLKPLKGMRVNAKRTSLKESNWRKYAGSSQFSIGREIETKEILYLCTNKRTATYLEARELFNRSALESDTYLNKNILGKFYDNCLDGLYGE
jgi:hypothetical protein